MLSRVKHWHRLFEARFVFRSKPYPLGEWEPADFAFEDVEFSASDGVRLHGWFCPAPRPDEPGPVVLYCHGQKDNIASPNRIFLAKAWQRRFNARFFMFDYRGYGKSEGITSEQGVYRDSRAAYDWLVSHQGVRDEELVVLGTSLGGAVAIELVAEQGICPAALVLESTFCCLVESARRRYFGLPLHWVFSSRFYSLGRVPKIKVPTLVVHGDRDHLVPLSNAQRIYEALDCQKSYLEIPGAGHFDVVAKGGELYLDGVARFLTETSIARRMPPMVTATSVAEQE